MYTFANKERQTPAMRKLSVNSNKTQNNLQPPTMKSKMKDIDNLIKISPLINKRNISKSKFTVSRTSKLSKEAPSDPPLSSTLALAAKKANRKPDAVRKSNMTLTAPTKTKLTDNSCSKKGILKHKNKTQASEKVKPGIPSNNPRETCEISVQTIESEILNHLLIVGDFKIITPSKSVKDEIDKLQKEKLTEKLLISKRRFEEHSQKEEQHLDDLNEFLDKSFITRKLPKLSDNILDEDRKLMESMDELLQREKPRIESITDIKIRIKRKERDLLSLFDRFQQKNEVLAK